MFLPDHIFSAPLPVHDHDDGHAQYRWTLRHPIISHVMMRSAGKREQPWSSTVRVNGFCDKVEHQQEELTHSTCFPRVCLHATALNRDIQDSITRGINRLVPWPLSLFGSALNNNIRCWNHNMLYVHVVTQLGVRHATVVFVVVQP